jgi:hypothetical protein
MKEKREEVAPSLPNSNARTQKRTLTWLLRSALILGLCFVALEVTSRAFWRLSSGIPIWRPDLILHSHYPEARAVDRGAPDRGGETFDVLLLGGSSLNSGWGQVQPALREQLAIAGHKNVRMFNLAMPGHTSQDSRLKYEMLSGYRFDLVIVYDGLNDTRANNAPPGIYRADYGHYSWYELANALAPYHGEAKLALPYTMRRVALGVRQTTRRHTYVSIDEVQRDWIRYGSDVRSADTFERNMSEIIALAEQRGDPLLLMTFASYVPPNYSKEAFEEKSLDYRLHLTPIEAWGARDHVVAGLKAHNNIVRRLATQHRVLFVDQEALMKDTPSYFNDICHFSIAGAVRFAENVRGALSPRAAGALDVLHQRPAAASTLGSK